MNKRNYGRGRNEDRFSQVINIVFCIVYNLFNMESYGWDISRRCIMIHFKNIDEVLQILRDVYTYMNVQNRNDKLGNKITTRIGKILEDNDNTKLSGEANENNKRDKES